MGRALARVLSGTQAQDTNLDCNSGDVATSRQNDITPRSLSGGDNVRRWQLSEIGISEIGLCTRYSRTAILSVFCFEKPTSHQHVASSLQPDWTRRTGVLSGSAPRATKHQHEGDHEHLLSWKHPPKRRLRRGDPVVSTKVQKDVGPFEGRRADGGHRYSVL